MDAIPIAPSAGRDDALARIEARLERIERMMGRFERLAEQLPGMAGAAGDVLDEWAARDGHADERVRAITHLIDRVTKPEVLHALTVLVDQIEAAPGLVAMAVDTVDELARDAEARGFDLHELASNLAEATRGLVILASRPEVRDLLESDLFEKGAVTALSNVARSLSDAQREPEPPPGGVLRTLSSLRDPDVQRAVGFALGVAKRFGRTMNTAPQLGAGDEEG